MHNLIDSSTFFSGDLLKKIQVAKSAIAFDPTFQTEVDALTKAIPAEVRIDDVDISIGSTWIPPEMYEAFCLETFLVRTKFYYSPTIGVWEIHVLGNEINSENFQLDYEDYDSKGIRERCQVFAVDKTPIDGLFTMCFFMKVPIIRRKTSPLANRKQCAKTTGNAVAKQDSIRKAFSSWCKEGERGEQLQKIYNDRMNRSVLRNWDGSGEILRTQLPATGISPTWLAKLRPYQLDAIWRLCVSGNTLLGLEVGLGKTIVLIVAAMLRRQFRTCQKALFVVQKSTLLQFYRTFREAYPNAQVLCATGDDCSEGNRQKFLAKASMWRWDCIILTHENFKAIPVKAETEADFVQTQLDAIEQELMMLLRGKNTSKKHRVMKQLENLRNVKMSRLAELATSRDTGLFFEDLGIDLLIIDEAQNYKNDFVASKLTITGIGGSQSDRAEDFHLKLSWLRERSLNNNFLWLSTGTPEPTNSISGVFVFQRYLQPEVLSDRLIAHFDSWLMAFARVKAELEPRLGCENGIAQVARIREVVNLPELLQMWLATAHIKRYDDVKGQGDFTRPDMRFKKVTSYLSDFQAYYMKDIETRYSDISRRTPAKFPRRDNEGYLVITKKKVTARIIHPITGDFIKDESEAIKRGIDYDQITDGFFKIYSEAKSLMVAEQLIDKDIPFDSKCKLNQVVKRITKWWGLTKKERLTQLVFLDLGTPGGSTKVPLYEFIKSRLIESGVDECEIAFIHDAKDDEAKERLFEKVNNGVIRVLVGSTSPMGIGVNVQKRVKAIHLVDIPYRPDQYEQRLGRAIRSGNINNTVLVYQYLVQGEGKNYGADACQFSLLQNKIKIREKILRGDPTVRRMEEENQQQSIYAMLTAHSTGDSKIIEYLNLKEEIRKLEDYENLLLRDIKSEKVKNPTQESERKIEALQADLEKVATDSRLVFKSNPAVFQIVLGTEAYVGFNLTNVGATTSPQITQSPQICLWGWLTLVKIPFKLPSLNQGRNAALEGFAQAIADVCNGVRSERFNEFQIIKIGEFCGLEVCAMAHSKNPTPDDMNCWMQGESGAKWRFSHGKTVAISNMEKRLEKLLSATQDLTDEIKHIKGGLENERKRSESRLAKAIANKKAVALEIEEKTLVYRTLEAQLNIKAEGQEENQSPTPLPDGEWDEHDED